MCEVLVLKQASRWMRRLQTHVNSRAPVEVEGAGAALETVVEYTRNKLKQYSVLTNQQLVSRRTKQQLKLENNI